EHGDVWQCGEEIPRQSRWTQREDQHDRRDLKSGSRRTNRKVHGRPFCASYVEDNGAQEEYQRQFRDPWYEIDRACCLEPEGHGVQVRVFLPPQGPNARTVGRRMEMLYHRRQIAEVPSTRDQHEGYRECEAE